MKYCDEYAVLLDLYVDGELSPEEMLRVRDHLETCSGCRAYVDDALTIRAAFPDAEETEVPTGFAGDVMAAIRAEAPAKTGRKPSLKLFWKTAAPLAACLAVIVLLQTGTWGGGQNHSAADSTAAPRSAAPASAAGTAEAASEGGMPEVPQAAEPSESPADAAQSPKTAQNYTAADAPSVGVAQAYSLDPPADTVDPPWLTLTAEEAGSLLADFTPVAETESELRYELTAEQLDALLAALSEAGIVPAGEAAPAGAEGGTTLVTVTK